jgi:acyl carrier protein
MTRQEFLREFETMVKVDPGTLGGHELLENLAHWDSLQMLDFVVVVEAKFSVVLDGVAVSKARTVNDLVGFVADHLTG